MCSNLGKSSKKWRKNQKRNLIPLIICLRTSSNSVSYICNCRRLPWKFLSWAQSSNMRFFAAALQVESPFFLLTCTSLFPCLGFPSLPFGSSYRLDCRFWSQHYAVRLDSSFVDLSPGLVGPFPSLTVPVFSLWGALPLRRLSTAARFSASLLCYQYWYLNGIQMPH